MDRPTIFMRKKERKKERKVGLTVIGCDVFQLVRGQQCFSYSAALKHTRPLPLKGSSELSARAHPVVSHVVCLTAYSNRLSKILNKTLHKIFKETLKADCRHLNSEDNGKGYVFLPGDFAKSIMLLCNVSTSCNTAQMSARFSVMCLNHTLQMAIMQLQYTYIIYVTYNVFGGYHLVLQQLCDELRKCPISHSSKSFRASYYNY